MTRTAEVARRSLRRIARAPDAARVARNVRSALRFARLVEAVDEQERIDIRNAALARLEVLS